MESAARAPLDRLVRIVSMVVDRTIEEFDDAVNERRDHVPNFTGLRVSGWYHTVKRDQRMLTIEGPERLLVALVKQYEDDERFERVFARRRGHVAFILT